MTELATTVRRDDVRSIIREEFADVLADISFRINQAYDLLERGTAPVRDKARGMIYAEDMNLQTPMLTGYVTTPNTPTQGSIAWTDLHIVWRGVDYVIADGNTPNRYATFVKPAVYTPGVTAPVALATSPTKPVLGPEDTIVFVNDNGIPRVAIGSSIPQVVADNAIDTASIQANAVTNAQLGANSVNAQSLADGAVVRTAQLSANVVSAGAIANGAIVRNNQMAANVVTGAQISDGSVLRSSQINANVVTNTQIAPNAVNAASIADGSVTRTAQLAANVVAAGAIANGAIVRNNQMAANVVTSAQVADGAVNRTTMLAANVVNNSALAFNAVQENNVVAGSLSPTRFNTYQHLFY